MRSHVLRTLIFQMSHSCLVHELHRFPLLKTRINEIVGNFLLEGLEPSQTMIRHLIEMEVYYTLTMVDSLFVLTSSIMILFYIAD